MNACQGVVKCPAQPSAAFDEQGLVFAVAADSGIIKLYDVRSYDKGPFATFAVGNPSTTDMHVHLQVYIRPHRETRSAKATLISVLKHTALKSSGSYFSLLKSGHYLKQRSY